jgi:hypothetical protein
MFSYINFGWFRLDWFMLCYSGLVWITLVQFEKDKCLQFAISRRSSSDFQLLSSLVPELKKPPLSKLEPRTLFEVVASLPVISPTKEATLDLLRRSTVLDSELYNLHRYSKQDSFSGFVYLILQLQLSLGTGLLSCLVSELQETPLSGIEVRTLVPEFRPSYVLFLVSRDNNGKFGANLCIRSRARRGHTYI